MAFFQLQNGVDTNSLLMLALLSMEHRMHHLLIRTTVPMETAHSNVVGNWELAGYSLSLGPILVRI